MISVFSCRFQLTINKDYLNLLCLFEIFFNLTLSLYIIILYFLSIMSGLKEHNFNDICRWSVFRSMLSVGCLILSSVLFVLSILIEESSKCLYQLIVLHFSVDIIKWILISMNDFVNRDNFNKFNYVRNIFILLYTSIIFELFFTFILSRLTIYHTLIALQIIFMVIQIGHLFSFLYSVNITDYIVKQSRIQHLFCRLDCIFSYIFSLIQSALSNELNDEKNTLKLDQELDPKEYKRDFKEFLNFWTIVKLVKKKVVTISILKLLILTTSLTYPVILNYFVIYLTKQRKNLSESLIYLAAFVVNSIISGFSMVYYGYYNTKLGLNLKSQIIPSLFERILRLPYFAIGSLHQGQLLDNLTTDIDRIVNFFPSLQELWSLPIQIVVAVALLYQQVGVACFAGLVFIVLLIPVNKFLANKIGQYSSGFMAQKDERMKLVTDFLKSIITVKVGCYEQFYLQAITDKRQLELNFLKKQKYLDAFCVIFWAISPVIISLLTFSTYIWLGNTIDSTKVLTCLALFSLLIGPMNMLPWVINGVVEASISLVRINKLQLCHLSAVQSALNIEKFTIPLDYKEKSVANDSVEPINQLIVMNQVKFYWANNSQEKSINSNNKFSLDKIDFHLNEGEYVGVVGQVGSGKTSFLLGLMGEMQLDLDSDGILSSRSQFKLSRKLGEMTVGFVTQNSWLLKKSIRDNICMCEPYDAHWYRTVVRACCLDVDFESMQHSDMTVIADHGVSLSGGQKSRICLARAIYQKCDWYILDDPLASLDRNVATTIMQNVITELLGRSTVILATHSTQYLRRRYQPNIRTPDRIYLVANNTVKQIDSTDDANIIDNTDILMQLNNDNEDPDSIQKSPPTSTINASNGETIDSKKLSPSSSLVTMNISEEHMEEGTIDFNVYKGYVKLAGYIITCIVLFSMLMMQGTKNASEFWLSIWSSTNTSRGNTVPNLTTTALSNDLLGIARGYPILFIAATPVRLGSQLSSIILGDNTSSSLKFYFTVYLSIVGANLVFSLLRGFSFAYGGIQASRRIHERIMLGLIRAQLTFYESTPRGRIINRLTSDLATIDDGLPFIVNICLNDIFIYIGSFIIIAISLPFVTVLIIPTLWFAYYIQFIYRVTSRAIKRLISINRSPMYSHFSEMLDGMLLLRSMRRIDCVIDQNKNYLRSLLRCEYSSMVLSCWLFIRLQLMGIAFIMVVISMAIVVDRLKLVEESLIGLACVYALSFAMLLSNLIKSATESEKAFIAVERCFEYLPPPDDALCVSPSGLRLEHESSIYTGNSADNEANLISLDSQEYSIVFDNVCLSYGENLVLHQISFQLPDRSNLGVIGRTGSGKSSLLKALFRLVEYQEDLGKEASANVTVSVAANKYPGYSGQIYLHGKNTREMSLKCLRQQISAMMQDSVIFGNSFRINIDPTNEFSEEEINYVINRLELVKYFPKLVKLENSKSFDIDCNIGEQNELSFGQHQLLCLARLMLTKNDILCLDEPSAFMDSTTEIIMQNVILKEFRNKTTIIVGHRLQMLVNVCDYFLVLDKGKIIEFGKVEFLIHDNKSYIYKILNS